MKTSMWFVLAGAAALYWLSKPKEVNAGAGENTPNKNLPDVDNGSAIIRKLPAIKAAPPGNRFDILPGNSATGVMY